MTLACLTSIGAAFRVLSRRPVIPRGFSHTQICRTRYGLHYPRDLAYVDPDLTGAEYCPMSFHHFSCFNISCRSGHTVQQRTTPFCCTDDVPVRVRVSSIMTALIHRNPSTSPSVSPVVARELGRHRTATPIHLLPSSLFSLRERGARVWGHVVVSRLGCRVLRTVSFFFLSLGVRCWVET